jgi:predicted outer membrane repeat protein
MPRPIAIVALIFAACLAAPASGHGDTTVTVCPSGCDYTSIQDAIDQAAEFSTILVKAGTYNENEINTAGKTLTITGEVASDGSPLTTISGANFDVDENSSVFYFDSGEGSSTVLEHLIITEGAAHGYGGGIQIFNSSPTIRSCTIVDNSALYTQVGESANPKGSGIYLSESESLIEDCWITGNTNGWSGFSGSFGGGIYVDKGAPTIARCRITDNTCEYTGGNVFPQNPCGNCTDSAGVCGQAQGIGIATDDTTLTITDCLIDGNTTSGYRGGVLETPYSALCDNETRYASAGGGLYFKNSTVTITDTVISNNWTERYGGIFSSKSSINLLRCEIRGNNDTGIYLFEGTQGTVRECLIGSNSNAGISAYKTNLVLTDSVIVGNSIGVDAGEEASVSILRTIIADNSYDGGQGGISLSSADDATDVTLSESYLCGNPVGGAGALTSNQVNTGYPSDQVHAVEGTVVSGSCQTTITVEQDGTGDFTNIQEAIDAAPIGSTVQIGAGTWPGGWTTRARAINIQGTPDIGSAPLTIIDGGGSETGITVAGNGGGQTTISDLQVINCFSQDDGAGMVVGTANLKLIGCIFQGNQTTGYAAGILFTGSNATLDACRFIQNNAIAAPGGGMLIGDGASVTISGCTFNENTAANGGGAICVADDGDMTCVNSSFRANSIEPRYHGGAILITSAATAELTQNFFCGNSPDQVAGSYTDGGNNTLYDSCGTETVTVASDGSAQFDSVSKAIGAVGSGSTIQIAAGTYDENIDTLGKAIRLVGEVDFFGLPATFISPATDAGESTVLTCDSGEGPATIFENLAFVTGYNPSGGAGGVTCNGTSPSFVNCLIADNFGYNAGGLYCENGSEPRLYRCVFSGNGGGFYDDAPGGLASASGSNPSLKDCLFCDNYGDDPNAPANISGDWTDLGGNELLTDCPIPACVADIDRDGIINGVDFAYILKRWGSDDPLADLNGDGQVDAADLGLAIASWGPCS